jgi:hypothetical protein
MPYDPSPARELANSPGRRTKGSRAFGVVNLSCVNESGSSPAGTRLITTI